MSSNERKGRGRFPISIQSCDPPRHKACHSGGSRVPFLDWSARPFAKAVRSTLDSWNAHVLRGRERISLAASLHLAIVTTGVRCSRWFSTRCSCASDTASQSTLASHRRSEGQTSFWSTLNDVLATGIGILILGLNRALTRLSWGRRMGSVNRHLFDLG
jgi:hypothetical protein